MSECTSTIPDALQPATKPAGPPSVHESAVRMQMQFALTGAYDAKDVTNVLGDPRHSVTSVVTQWYSVEPRTIAKKASCSAVLPAK